MLAAYIALVTFIFFLSGVAALIFEALWFRQAGLAFGNSVWASALVVSSYMAGLAVGNGLAARHGERIKRPIRVYAGLELVIAASGLTLVVLLPGFSVLLTATLAPFVETTAVLNAIRFLAGFLILLVPAIAMGATLPVLVSAVPSGDRSFGQILGLLYGANTLGAVVGAISSEFVWTPWVGIIGSGMVAAGFNLLAAGLAFAISRRAATIAPPPDATHAVASRPIGFRANRLLLAAFGSGAILLALEVVWFRILRLFLPSVPEVFASLLAIVLAGIAIGGILASVWLRFVPGAHRYVSAVALVSGVIVLASYVVTPTLVYSMGTPSATYYPALVRLSLSLMFGTSVLSGVLFPLLGQCLHEELKSKVRAAGLLTLANTAGATIGPLFAGFVLLPRVGMERSVVLLAIAYLGVAVLAFRKEAFWPWNMRTSVGVAALACFVFAIVQFPFGSMSTFYQVKVIGALPRGETLLQFREGPLQTSAYTRMDYLGQPDYYRLVTDSYSMSGTGLNARRYMALYTYLPLALHPGAKDALLISFGVGTTAKSLTDTEEFEHIDVVDISRDVIEMSSLRFGPEEHPLNDPRVQVHIEDGRFFLNSTERRYDLITAEPPPPHVAGVENLYSQEYFELVRSRLKEGGLVSYWLPIINYDLEEAKATVKGFCAAFPDCSLWDAAPMNWTLVGSRNAVPVDEVTLRRQWQSKKAWPELELTGIEKPEQVAALFLADAQDLEAWTRDSLPLTDNWPSRSPRVPKVWMQPPPHYAEWMAFPGTRDRFERSAFIRSIWPESFREKSLPYFELQELASRQLYAIDRPQSIALIHRILTTTDLETLPLWMLGSHHVRQRAASNLEGEKGVAANEVRYELGLKALVHRDYAAAVDLFGRVHSGFKFGRALRLYALCMAGEVEQARTEARSHAGPVLPNYWPFMESEFGLTRPASY